MLFCALFLSAVVLVRADQPALRSLIVGGQDAVIDDYRFMVSVRFADWHWCGGSIITRNVVLTAAHCFRREKTSSDFSIVAGYTYLADMHGKNLANVQEIISHENFDVGMHNNNDIAILLLDRLLFYNDLVQPIHLATERPPPGVLTTVIGWGFTNENGTISNHLQKVDLKLFGNDECREVFHPQNITPTMMCAGNLNGGQDACQEDSGGPMIFDKKLLGIVSFGVGCGRKGLLGVYASIPDLYEWIVINLVKNNASLY